MKLVRFASDGSPVRLGILAGDQVRDLAATFERLLDLRGVARAGDLSRMLFSGSTRAFLQAGEVAASALANIEGAVKDGQIGWVSHPAGSVQLLAPIHDPEKLICVGLNYKDHAEEAKLPIPKEPPLFGKWTNAIIGPGDPILRPRGCTQLDYEVELGVVIGKTCRYVRPEQALDYVFGYTIVHDVSARDFQFRTSQWMAGKIPDTFCPIGPWIADRAEVPDPHVLDLKTFVNGTLLQDGNTKNFIFDVRALVSYLSNLITLGPGDVIATGTPGGVGFARKPPVFLVPGDLVRMEITGLGALENPVKDA
jgi:acylpyruvate hydrolase